MGIMILISAFIVEVGFAAYCFATHSRHVQLRSVIWLGAFASFVLFTLAAVIQWSFRWYLLGGLLFSWAVMGVWRLLRRPAAATPFSPLRTVLNTLGVLLLIFITLIPLLIFPQFTLPAPTGPYPVATASFTYTDVSRAETFTNTGAPRQVNVKFWFPQAATGVYPLVLFSHGTGGIKSSNTATFIDLASNGYVVCALDHPYHSLFTMGADGKFVWLDTAYWQEYMAVVNHTVDAATGYQLTQKWLALRVADINFVIATILDHTKDHHTAAVYRLIDPTKIGVMGHSLGGGASGQVARLRSDISAVINLDGDLLGEYVAFKDGQEVLNQQPFPAPLLNIYADDMQRALAIIPNAAAVVAAEHARATAPAGYDVYLPGTNHFSVTDLPLASPFLVSLMTRAIPAAAGSGADPYTTITQMNGIILHFFNVYLKGEGTFRGA